MSLKVVVVVVVSTGRSTGFTPYPTNGYPVLDFASVGQVLLVLSYLELFPHGVALHPNAACTPH